MEYRDIAWPTRKEAKSRGARDQRRWSLTTEHKERTAVPRGDLISHRSLLRSTTSWLLALVVVTTAYAPAAQARSCQVSASMYNNYVSKLWARWEDQLSPTVPTPTPIKYGIKNLFVANSACGGCHSADPTVAGGASARYRPCYACHVNDATHDHPPGLNFSDRTTFALQAYYDPTMTKAEAILLRAQDGTMPPGAAAADSNAPSPAPVGWCDEIITVYKQWLDAGMPY